MFTPDKPKLVHHNHKVYVGDFIHVGEKDHLGNGRTAPDPFSPPTSFYDIAQEMECDTYSNNMDFVRYYKPENVICVYNLTTKPLTEHPKFEKWKDEMDSGEMVSLFGWKWVLEC